MAVRFHMTLDPVHPRVMHIPCQAEPSAPWARPLEWRKACRAAGARQQRFAAHVPLPSGVGSLPMVGHVATLWPILPQPPHTPSLL